MLEKRNFSAAHRLLHWSIAFVMLFILLTIFLRENWMSKYFMRDIIMENLANLNIDISQDQAMKVAKTIRGNMWQWHINAGYLLIGLYLVRLVVNAKERGINFSFITSKEIPMKEKFQKWVYLLFYVGIAGSLITGLCIINDIGDHELMEDIHKLSIYYLTSFIFIHFAGVILGEFTDQKNIVSEMIHGKNKEN